MARGRPSRRRRRVLDPPRRRQRGAVREPQPRRPDRRRPRARHRQPPPALRGARVEPGPGRDGPAGPRRRDRSPRRAAGAVALARAGAGSAARSTVTSIDRSGPRGARLRRRLPAGRARRSRTAWRCSTAAGGGSPAGIVGAGAAAIGADGGGDRPRDRAVLLRGRRRGPGRLRAARRRASPTAGCSTSRRLPAGCSSGPASRRSRTPASAPAASARLFFSHRGDGGPTPAGRPGSSAGVA